MRQKQAYLGLGSNLGDRERNLAGAWQRLEAEGIRVVERSSLYETEPRDLAEQPWFLNQVVKVETSLFPMQLLSVALRVEREMGRERGPGTKRKGPRLIDIDILLYGKTVVETPELAIPHPAMMERRFVLEPLAEIAPELRHPVTGQRIAAGLAGVAGQRCRRVGAGRSGGPELRAETADQP